MMAADSGQITVLVPLLLTSGCDKCDTVDHTVQWKHLHCVSGLSGSDCFTAYLPVRTFSVAGKIIKTDVNILSCGVPQGSELGPVLSMLYMLPLGSPFPITYTDVLLLL